MKLKSMKTCKIDAKLNCGEKCASVIYNMHFRDQILVCLSLFV